MRERTPLSREILQQLPRLKLIASTGPRNASVDMRAAEERGILVTSTGYESTPTIELTWALILAGSRHLVREAGSPGPRSTSSMLSPYPWITLFESSTTCWQRRTSATSRKISIASSTATPRPALPRGSTPILNSRVKQYGTPDWGPKRRECRAGRSVRFSVSSARERGDSSRTGHLLSCWLSA
jgi:hypothetical protein